MSNEVSDTIQSDVDVNTLSPELRKVIEFEKISEQPLINAIPLMHEISEQTVREAWDKLPASAQNILDSFEQFHALISVSQAFAAANTMASVQDVKLPESMSEQEQQQYRMQLMDQVLHGCVKDMVKQLKTARRDPILKRDFDSVFKK